MNSHTQHFKIVTISHIFAVAFLVAGAVLMHPVVALADDSYDSGYSGTSVDYSSTNYDTSAYNSGYSGAAIDYGATNYGTSAYDSGYSGTNVDTASNNYGTTGYDSGYSGTGVSYDSNNYGGNNLYASNGNDLYASTCATGCGTANNLYANGNDLYASNGNNLYASNGNDLYASSNGNNLYASNGNNLYASSQGNNLYASNGGCTTGSCGGSYGGGYSTGCTTGCGSYANGGSSAYWTNAGYWTGGSGGSYGGCTTGCGTLPPPPVVDCCPNLAGLQTSIPAGYVLQNGNCVQQPVYTCPSGTYGSYPNCVTPAPIVYNNGAPCCTAAPVVYNNPPVYYNNQPVYNHQPYVSLTQVPYTGLDLTPAQEILYWGFLVLWCLLAAYLIAVKKIQNRIAVWFKRVFFGDEDATATHTAEAYAESIPMAPGYTARVAEVDVIDEFILMQINRPSRA